MSSYLQTFFPVAAAGLEPVAGDSIANSLFLLDEATWFMCGYLAVVAIVTGTVRALTQRSFVGARIIPGVVAYILSLCAFGAAAAAADLRVVVAALAVATITGLALYVRNDEPGPQLEAVVGRFVLPLSGLAAMLFGMVLLHGETGSLAMADLGRTIGDSKGGNPLLYAAMTMVLAGMGIFIAAVPFHTWATTLHRRSGIGVSGVILAAMIPSCFLVLLRLVYTARIPELFVMMPFSFPDLIVGLSVLTMTVGNLYAYRQRHLHTMLVGAVIAQSGVALMGLLFVPSLGSGSHGLWSVNWSVLLFLVVTGGAVLLALSVLEVVERDARLESSEPVHKGLFRRSPWLAVALSLALMSLAGLPLSAGFMAKYNLFSELMVVSRGKLTVVLIIALINGLITLSYLLNSVLEMVRKVSFDAPDRRAPRRAVCAVIVTMLAVLVLVFGVWPGPLVRLARQAGHSIRYGGGKEVGRPGPVKLAPYAELYGSTEK